MAGRPGRQSVRVGLASQPAVPLVWPPGDGGSRGPTGREAARHCAPTGTAPGARRILVAGVGYRNLRDLSVGPALAERLAGGAWPDGVHVEDLSFGAIHVLHWLRDRPSYDAAIFVAGAARGRQPGSVHRSTWTAVEVSAEAVQERVAEAVTGIISLDTLLIVLGYFEALPPRVTVIEIEPRDTEWGPAFSPPVEAAMRDVVALVRDEVEAARR